MVLLHRPLATGKDHPPAPTFHHAPAQPAEEEELAGPGPALVLVTDKLTLFGCVKLTRLNTHLLRSTPSSVTLRMRRRSRVVSGESASEELRKSSAPKLLVGPKSVRTRSAKSDNVFIANELLRNGKTLVVGVKVVEGVDADAHALAKHLVVQHVVAEVHLQQLFRQVAARFGGWSLFGKAVGGVEQKGKDQGEG